MAILHTTLFDTWPIPVAAAPPALLFQVVRGGDAVHIATFTNMRGAGQLPSTEEFEIHKIYIIPDRQATVLDPVALLHQSLVELRIKERTVFSCPARYLCAGPAWQGMTVAVAFEAAELINEPFILDLPLTIPGGVSFVVECTPSAALFPAAIFNIVVVLEGYLNTPD